MCNSPERGNPTIVIVFGNHGQQGQCGEKAQSCYIDSWGVELTVQPVWSTPNNNYLLIALSQTCIARHILMFSIPKMDYQTYHFHLFPPQSDDGTTVATVVFRIKDPTVGIAKS